MRRSESEKPAVRAERDEAVERDGGERAADDERSLGLARHPTPPRIAGRKPGEDVVEGSDRAAEQAAATGEQVALDPVDVRPVRHDQDRLVVEARQIALEEQRDFARMRRPGKEGEPHLPIVERPQDVSRAAPDGFLRSELGRRPAPWASGRGGLPRGRASCPAHSSQRSATFEPRRASE